MENTSLITDWYARHGASSGHPCSWESSVLERSKKEKEKKKKKNWPGVEPRFAIKFWHQDPAVKQRVYCTPLMRAGFIWILVRWNTTPLCWCFLTIWIEMSIRAAFRAISFQYIKIVSASQSQILQNIFRTYRTGTSYLPPGTWVTCVQSFFQVIQSLSVEAKN